MREELSAYEYLRRQIARALHCALVLCDAGTAKALGEVVNQLETFRLETNEHWKKAEEWQSDNSSHTVDASDVTQDDVMVMMTAAAIDVVCVHACVDAVSAEHCQQMLSQCQAGCAWVLLLLLLIMMMVTAAAQHVDVASTQPHHQRCTKQCTHCNPPAPLPPPSSPAAAGAMTGRR